MSILKTYGQPNFSVRLKDKYGYTVLHHAVYRNNYGLVEKLLEEKNLDFYETDAQGNNALHLAAQGENVEMIQILMKNIGLRVTRDSSRIALRGINLEGKTPLHMAAATGFLDTVRVILDHEDGKTILETKDNRQQTALLIAASAGNIDVVNLMIEKGANPRVVNKDKESAIHISARSEQ